MSKTFKLPYYVSNGGDGSATVRFCQSKDEAQKIDDEQNEEGEGWGESSASSVELKVENDTLLFSRYECVDGKYQQVWKPVKS